MKAPASRVSRGRRPQFSIITICFNARDTLEQTIESVVSQKGPSFEYLVIDGGSTDGTVDLLKAWDRKITWWVSEKDRGISDAFNKGLRRARGEWVGSVNADDWYEPGALSRVAKLPSSVEVACGRMRYWEGGRASSVFDAAPALLPREMTVNHQATFARRRLFERLGSFREDFKYAMDYELFLRFHRGGARFAAVDSVLANMRYGGVSHRHARRSLWETRRAQRLHGASFSGAWGRWAWLTLRATARRFLERLGLRRWVAWYRRRFSVVPKTQS